MAYSNFDTRIKLKRDSSANWATNNPILLNGEVAVVDTDSGYVRFKVGDGVSTYTALPFCDDAIWDSIYDEVQLITFSCTESDTGALSYTLMSPTVTSGGTVKSTLVDYIQFAKNAGLIVKAQLQVGEYTIEADSIGIHYSATNVIGTIYFSFTWENTNYFLQVGGDYPNGGGYKQDVIVIDDTLSQSGAAADAKETGDAISALETLVGDESVADQITNALEETKAKLEAYTPTAIIISPSTTNLPDVVDGAILVAYDA